MLGGGRGSQRWAWHSSSAVRPGVGPDCKGSALIARGPSRGVRLGWCGVGGWRPLDLEVLVSALVKVGRVVVALQQRRGQSGTGGRLDLGLGPQPLVCHPCIGSCWIRWLMVGGWFGGSQIPLFPWWRRFFSHLTGRSGSPPDGDAM
jgi:hypothetical protein